MIPEPGSVFSRPVSPRPVSSPPVTRVETVMGVSPAFRYGRPIRAGIVACAERSGARPEVVALLRRLPDRRFDSPKELWFELPDVPVEL